MNPELASLYQELIVEHGRRPRNLRRMEGADRTAEGFNPLCGDQITLYVRLRGDVVEDVCFEGQGCAISRASASLMTSSLKGKTTAEALALFERVHALVVSGPRGPTEDLGKLAALSGVWEFPARVKCASLAWHTFRSALGGGGQAVSTE